MKKLNVGIAPSTRVQMGVKEDRKFVWSTRWPILSSKGFPDPKVVSRKNRPVRFTQRGH